MGDKTAAHRSQDVATSAFVRASHIFGCGLATGLALISLLLSLTGPDANPLPLFFGTLILLIELWWPTTIQSAYGVWSTFLLILFKGFLTLCWVFYILPMGLIMQARGIDPLNRYFHARAKTYWQEPLPVSSMQKTH